MGIILYPVALVTIFYYKHVRICINFHNNRLNSRWYMELVAYQPIDTTQSYMGEYVFVILVMCNTCHRKRKLKKKNQIIKMIQEGCRHFKTDFKN